MTTTLAHQTQIAIHIVITDDSGTVANFLIGLTLLIDAFRAFGVLVRFGQSVASLIWLLKDLAEAVRFTLTVWGIGLRAVAYGFTGLRL